MSEMKKAAQSLVEVRTERFESRHALAESQARLAGALERSGIRPPLPFAMQWVEAAVPTLEVTFPRSRKARIFLNATSLVFVLLMAASLYLLMRTDEGALRFLVPLFTGLAILGFPFVTLAIASTRLARESRIRRAIQAAFADDEDAR